MPRPPPGRPVSPNDPCPVLRALVGEGLLPDGTAPFGEVADGAVRVGEAGDGSPRLPGAAISAIALIANSLGPLDVARNATGGLRLDALRDGPLDKKGAGAGILDANARVVRAELDRLDDFAGDRVDADGRRERGLALDDLRRMMDANFERAAGRQRAIDRGLMDGEWPVLLKVVGQDGPGGRYLALSEVRDLFERLRLPQRMRARLGTA